MDEIVKNPGGPRSGVRCWHLALQRRVARRFTLHGTRPPLTRAPETSLIGDC